MLAMHIPDGFLDGPTSLVAGARSPSPASRSACDGRRRRWTSGRSRSSGSSRRSSSPPRCSTSRSPTARAATCSAACWRPCSSGPYAGALAVTVVLVVQALLFADGGLSALGLNVVNMALVGAFAGYGIFLLRRALGTTVVGHARRRHRRRSRRRSLAAIALHRRVRHRRQRRRLRRLAGDGDDRRPRPDRHRRGDHHGARRRLGDGDAARPRLRRPGHRPRPSASPHGAARRDGRISTSRSS